MDLVRIINYVSFTLGECIVLICRVSFSQSRFFIRLSLMQASTGKAGGAYIYANHRGGDGGRLYFDGCSLVCVNGNLVVQASQFSLTDVEVVTATIDLEDIRNFRHSCKSFQEHSSSVLDSPLNIVDVDFALCTTRGAVSPSIQPRFHTPEEECALGPACWLWDYLRRSGSAGSFFKINYIFSF